MNYSSVKQNLSFEPMHLGRHSECKLSGICIGLTAIYFFKKIAYMAKCQSVYISYGMCPYCLQ